MRFIDSHVHLCDYPAPEKVVREAALTQTVLYSQSIDEATSLKTASLARAWPFQVAAFIGVHPSEAEKTSSLEWSEEALKGAVGVGEIGLDPKYSSDGGVGRQSEVFEELLGIAVSAGKPVQVHSRGAERLTLEKLSGYKLKSVLMHWFQGEELVSQVMDKGYYVSFGPAILASKKLQGMALKCDPGLVLAESDGPVPFSGLGGRHGPSLIPSVVLKLSQLWGRKFSEVEEGLVANGTNYLGDAGKG